MLSFLPTPVKGILTILFICLNTIFWGSFLISLALLKLVLPIKIIREWLTKVIINIATFWVGFNSFTFRLFTKTHWQVTGNQDLSMDEWYLINCNHQSWADISVVQTCLNRKAPMLKFFLKKELIWVPILGLCWWGLDFPFMKRYSREYLEKHPKMKGKDMETTIKACKKFKSTPISVFNFMEGTRFTTEKHTKQKSPFKNLLKPKAGGAAFVLESMGNQLRTMLDITIVYPDDKFGFWEFISDQIPHIIVDIEKVSIPTEFLGKSYLNDTDFKKSFQEWVSLHWQEKDQKISRIKKSL